MMMAGWPAGRQASKVLYVFVVKTFDDFNNFNDDDDDDDE